MRWLSLPSALRTVTEPRDRPAIVALGTQLQLQLGVRPVPEREKMLMLVRGAQVTKRSDHERSDDSWPLGLDVEHAAHSLAALGAVFKIERVLSAPTVRCVETVAELARRESLEVERSDHLTGGSIEAALRLVAQARGTGTVLCTHEGVMEGVLDHLVRHDRTILNKRFRVRKGSAWVLTGDDSRYQSAYYLPLPAADLVSTPQL